MRRKTRAGEYKSGQPFETRGGLKLRVERVGRTWVERGDPVCFVYLEPWTLPVPVQDLVPSLIGSKNTAMEAAHRRDVVLRWLWATAIAPTDELWQKLVTERRATWWMSVPAEVLAEVRRRVLEKR